MLKGGGQRTIRIRKVQNQDYEHLTFLTTYIIPFFGFSFDDLNRLAAYLILLILIGYIFIKTGKYYANPTLAVMGFKLYKGTFSDQNGIYENITVISTDSLKAEQVVYYKLISENVFYVRKK